ncbi:MAG: cytochrome c biogenesis protein CcsA [Planctomycetes bacterium]|jgi:ABC-type transport system involved in cytochrome c biogenesis permease subunit|nr:cytochrome c biogenesis protein CcsA [Planctomycetota bacterium]
MHIKWDIQGLLIYLTLAGYAAALVQLLRKRKTGAGRGGLAFAFLAAMASYITRWVLSTHLPMQNLYEVFLLMAVLVWPISLLTEHMQKHRSWIMQAGDALIGVLVCFPAGFIFSAALRPLPPALQSALFGPHVAAYMIAYVLMARAAIPAVAAVVGHYGGQQLIEAERQSYGIAAAGFPLLSLGLILGSVWGKLAWGDWWGWDPKELWSLACWLVYMFYFHWRIVHPRLYIRTRLWLVITGFGFIVITLLWVNLSRLFGGMHSYAT